MTDEVEKLAEAIVTQRDLMDWRLSKVQGFLYGKDHVVRDCYLPGPEQEVWRQPASDAAAMHRFIDKYRAKIVLSAALSSAGLEVNKAGTFDALRVFGGYYDWACRNEWPASVQADDLTPILGRVEWNDPEGESYEVYVQHFRAAASLTEGDG